MININNIQTYYLNSNLELYQPRRLHMENILNKLNFTNYERFASDINFDKHGKRIGNILGHVNLVKYAMSKHMYPFLILEDDVQPIYDFPTSINIPNNANIIYLGSSLFQGRFQKLSLENFDNQYYRLIGGLTTHAIIIPNEYNAQLYHNIISEAIDKKIPIDASLAIMSSELNFLTPKNGPYFSQIDYPKLTNFLWNNVQHRFYKEII